MSEFVLRIRTTGPAFQHCPTAEIGRPGPHRTLFDGSPFLRRLADDLDRHRYAGAWPRPLYDSDGARVGQAEFVFAARQEPGEG
jgi:hypothetical protein